MKQKEVYEKELKKAQNANYEFLFNKTKKNLKDLHNLIEKYKEPNDASEIWES